MSVKDPYVMNRYQEVANDTSKTVLDVNPPFKAANMLVRGVPSFISTYNPSLDIWTPTPESRPTDGERLCQVERLSVESASFVGGDNTEDVDIIIPRTRLDDDIDVQEEVSNLDQETSSSPTII